MKKTTIGQGLALLVVFCVLVSPAHAMTIDNQVLGGVPTIFFGNNYCPSFGGISNSPTDYSGAHLVAAWSYSSCSNPAEYQGIPDGLYYYGQGCLDTNPPSQCEEIGTIQVSGGVGTIQTTEVSSSTPLSAGTLSTTSGTTIPDWLVSQQIPGDLSSTSQYFAGTSTALTPTNLLSFLNVPRLLETKVPFAYFFQIAAGIQEGVSETASSSGYALPVGNFTFVNTRGATTTMDFFSTSTIGVYLTPGIISIWRNFLLICLTIEFGYALYHLAHQRNVI